MRATVRVLLRSAPVHRTESEGDLGDLPAPVPSAVLPGDGALDDGVQGVSDGVGALLRRLYSILIDGTDASPEQLLATFGGNPNRGAPENVAVFVKTVGVDDVLAVGDEFLIRIPGPWDGPVRVVAASPTSFRLATLEGHLEAGQIEFRARPESGGLLFQIESWARPGDVVSHVLYDRIPVAREIQLNLWVETCLRLATRTGGRARDGVHVHTRTVPASLFA